MYRAALLMTMMLMQQVHDREAIWRLNLGPVDQLCRCCPEHLAPLNSVVVCDDGMSEPSCMLGMLVRQAHAVSLVHFAVVVQVHGVSGACTYAPRMPARRTQTDTPLICYNTMCPMHHHITSPESQIGQSQGAGRWGGGVAVQPPPPPTPTSHSDSRGSGGGGGAW
jgi:hypothetical protein